MTKSKYYWDKMVYFQIQDKKKLKFRMKKVSCNLVLLIVVRFLLIPIRLLSDRSEVAYQQKINKH